MTPGPSGSDSHRLMVAARILLAVFAVAVVAIVLTPGPPDGGGQQRLRLWLDEVHQTWMPGWITFGLIEFFSNVVMFVPLALFGALALRSRRVLVLPACVALSLGVETVQWLVLPGRDGALQDLIANTVGAAVGYLAALAVLRRVRRGRRGDPLPRPVPD